MLTKITGKKQDSAHLKILDNNYKCNTVDLEVSSYFYLPKNIEIEGNHLAEIHETNVGKCYKAKKAGIVRANSKTIEQSFLIRIQNFEYEGLSDYRHLEE